MGFLKSFFGAMAAAEISEKKREVKERERAQKAEYNNDQKVYRLEMSFFDYLEKINCVNASFNDYEEKRLISNDPWEVTRIIDGLKAQLKEYMTYGGNPVYIYDFEQMDLYIEIVKRLKEYGWIDKQEKYVKFADDTYWLDRDWEEEQKKRVWLAVLFALPQNEIKQTIKKDNNDFIPYIESTGENCICLEEAYFAPFLHDESGHYLPWEASICIKFTDKYIVFYNSDDHDEIYFKSSISNSNVEILGTTFVTDWAGVMVNDVYVLFKMSELERVQNFYKAHNSRIQLENRQAYEDIDTLSGVEFEKVCKRLLERMGFSVETTKASGDGGIDLIGYNTQPLLSGKYIIQCKRYAGSVGEPIIRDLYGVVTSERANKGILITTGHFTKSAISFAENKPIELIDGAQLKVLIEQYLKAAGGIVIPTHVPVASLETTDCEINEIASRGGNFPDYLFYNSNNTEIANIQECPDFLPIGCEELYRTVVSRMAVNPNNLCDTGHMISLLQDHIYNDKSWVWGDIPTNVLYENKREALCKVLSVCQNLRSIQYLYSMYLSISAQSHFMLGNWKTSIQYYEELLSLPEVLVEATPKALYAGELEFAAKIIHNICLILTAAGEDNLATDYRAKYDYVFELERYRTERLISNTPNLKDEFEKTWNQLSNISSIKDFYFDLTLEWGYGVDGDGMLVAIYKDCESSGEAKTASFNGAKEIRFLHDGAVAVMDYETGNSESRILVIQLQD